MTPTEHEPAQIIEEQKTEQSNLQELTEIHDKKRELEVAVIKVHDYLKEENGRLQTYKTLLGLLDKISGDNTQPEFQSIAILVGNDTILHSKQMNLGITDCNIAQSCQIAMVVVGANHARVRTYFCPRNLYDRMKKYPEFEDYEKENNLLQLQGSPKQVEWARVIRYKAYPQILAQIQEYKKSHPQVAEQLDKTAEKFRMMDNAKDWIESRDAEIADLVTHHFDKIIKTHNKVREIVQELNLSIEDRASYHKAKYPTFELEFFITWYNSKPPKWQEWAAGKPISELNKLRRVEIGRHLID